MAIGVSTFVKDSVLFVRDLLKAGITDPISGKRATGQNFVLTAYPSATVQYPIITVLARNVADDRSLGMYSEGKLLRMTLEVRVWARTNVERDTLFQQVYDKLRTTQLDSSTGTIENGLFDFALLSAVPISEEGVSGIHSMVAEYNYMVILSP